MTDIKEALKGMTADERKNLLEELKAEERQDKLNRRDAYEALRAQFTHEIKSNLLPLEENVRQFREWIEKETDAFYAIMRDYGQLRNADQSSFTVVDNDFKIEVRSNKVKTFDERADMAAERLMEYLKAYVAGSEKGYDDPMYQLAMTLLERNRQGDLDYKNISKLYEMEDRFDEEYKAIMSLFRESHTVTKTAVNFYFWRRDKNGVWRRIEPSFCRM
ncbi:MAG: DUF3164 family protein [Bacteroides sp.]|nr:DUF3164 family protein [Bacteroides sp.]